MSASHKPPALQRFFLPGLALLLLFWGANLLLTRWSAGNADPEEAARAEFRAKTLAELRADNAKKLDEYAWVNRTNGSVQIPICEAIRLVLPGLNASRPHAAYPIATPPAQPPVPPVPSPAPAL